MQPRAAVEVKARLDADGVTLHTEVETIFADDWGDAAFRIALALVENGVHVADDSRYNQSNAYSGGGQGVMGGFENKPHVISAADMWYEDVARACWGGLDGFEGSVPSQVEAFVPQRFSYDEMLPVTVLDVNHLSVVAMLVNADGVVVAARQTVVDASAAGMDEVKTAPAETADVVGCFAPDGRKQSAPGKGLHLLRLADGRVVKIMY